MLTLILGGAKSGKSSYAQSLCAVGRPAVFVATARSASDPEMTRRIARHREARPDHFRTVEAPFDIVDVVREAAEETVLVDCITLWLSNLAYRHRAMRPDAREKRIVEAVLAFATACGDRTVIAVSNDVGSGVVPETPVGREFRDLQGLANQMLAKEASRVVFMVAGIPMVLKE